MIRLPWIQIFIGDELAETSHLSTEEYGAHMLLRLHQWQHGELPTDDERLRRICRVDPEKWPSVRDTLAPLFDWQWHHQRTADTRKASEEKHENLSRNGRKGGRPRKEEKADGKPMESQAFDRLKADGKPNTKPMESNHHHHHHHHHNSQSRSTSPSAPASESLALEKEKKGTNAGDDMLVPFPKPITTEDGKRFLLDHGAPDDPKEIDRALRMLISGNLTPYDIEHWRAA